MAAMPGAASITFLVFPGLDAKSVAFFSLFNEFDVIFILFEMHLIKYMEKQTFLLKAFFFFDRMHVPMPAKNSTYQQHTTLAFSNQTPNYRLSFYLLFLSEILV
jgi:hypothetical protein